MNTLPAFPTPTKQLVEQYLNIIESDEQFNQTEKALMSLFANYSSNNDMNSVLLKTTAINSLYSTNIYSVIKMAQHILKIEFDQAILNKSINIIDNIASGHGIVNSKTGKEYRFYSFATKYCSWHNQNNYPIFDNYINVVLKIYNKLNHYSSDSNFKDYSNFKKTILSFRVSHNLENYSLKEIDKFLWLLGKEYLKIKKTK